VGVNMMREDNAAGTEMTAIANPVRHIHHHAYACWDSEETRHFYEDILGMPLVAAIVLEDSPPHGWFNVLPHVFRDRGRQRTGILRAHVALSSQGLHCTQRLSHRNVALEVAGNAMVRQFKRKLDAARVTNVLTDHGVSLSLRFNDPNGLILELMGNTPTSLEDERPSRASAHSVLQQWLYYRQNWWRRAAGMK